MKLKHEISSPPFVTLPSILILYFFKDVYKIPHGMKSSDGVKTETVQYVNQNPFLSKVCNTLNFNLNNITYDCKFRFTITTIHYLFMARFLIRNTENN